MFRFFFGSTPTGVTIEQEGFRWRNDDGSEAAATWRQAQDVNDTIAKNTNIRLRTLVNVSGDPATQQATKQYRRVGDADTEWRAVPAT